MERASIGPALELIDLDRPLESISDILATNLYHRLVAFGPTVPLADVLGSEVAVTVAIAGEPRQSGTTVVERATAAFTSLRISAWVRRWARPPACRIPRRR